MLLRGASFCGGDKRFALVCIKKRPKFLLEPRNVESYRKMVGGQNMCRVYTRMNQHVLETRDVYTDKC